MARHSLLIGVESYGGEGSLTPLTCPLADVDRVCSIFSDPRYMGEEATVDCVRDPSYAEATAAIGRFLNTVSRDDVCLFYFSGHGLRDAAGDLFLCFADTDERNLELSGLNIKRLRSVFDGKFLRRVLVILDCCYSGAAGAPLTKDSLTSKFNEVEEARADGTGLYVLSSAGVAETAKEGQGHSVFTHHFAEGIATGAADPAGRGEITVHDIAQYVAEKVPQDAPGQKPLLSSRAVAGSFTVAINAAAQARRLREEQDQTRAEIFRLASERLMEAHRAKDVSLAFMLEVLGWIDCSGEASVESPPMPLLAAYGSRECGLDELNGRWNAWKAEGGGAARETARASAEHAEAQAAREAWQPAGATAAPEAPGRPGGSAPMHAAADAPVDAPAPAGLTGQSVGKSPAAGPMPPRSRRRRFFLFLLSLVATLVLSFVLFVPAMMMLSGFGLADKMVAVFVLALAAGFAAYLIARGNRRLFGERGVNRASVFASSLSFAGMALAISAGDSGFAEDGMPIWLATVCPACFFGLMPFRRFGAKV